MALRSKVCICLILFAAVCSFAQTANQTTAVGKIENNNNGSLLASVIDRTITYQGIMKNSSGAPVPNSTYNLTFRIYKDAAGGLVLWASPSIPVSTTGGLFSTQLGPISLPFDTTYYISIEVQGDVEMSRQMMTMSPYSASSDTANYAKAGGGESKWSFRTTDTADTTLMSGGQWGLARNGNVLWGNADSTHVNLGIQCTTGTSGQNYKYCTVGGGNNNSAGGLEATICGGIGNMASGEKSFVGGGGLNVANGWGAVVSGGYGNLASNSEATVAGGENDTAAGRWSVVSGGVANAARSQASAISGGLSNVARANYASIGGGDHNDASGSLSTISGGSYNGASGSASAVGGGYANSAANSSSCIAGGEFDTVTGRWATISGGYLNAARGEFSAVLSGRSNNASDTAAVVGGGFQNTASGEYSVVGGGRLDTAKALYGGVASGYSNLAGDAGTDTGAYVGGGYKNSATGEYSTVGGGRYNNASGYQSTVNGGSNNLASGVQSAVGGGSVNFATGTYSAIGGGAANKASSVNTIVGGGFSNTASENAATVSGGYQNYASSWASTIGGGYVDSTKGIFAGVFSGSKNLAGDTPDDSGAFVGGGVSNKAISKHATVAGGWGNLASNLQATIGGGERDTASNQWATIAGGAHNIASGFASMIPGGSDNVAGGDRSFAAGLGAHANHDGSFVWADDSPVSYYSDRDKQTKFRAGGGVKFDLNAYRWVEFYDDGIDRLINVSNGAYLSRGGSWTNASDRNLKENFTQIDRSDLLQRIGRLPITRWNYKTEDRATIHIGPTAQDFNALFGVGNDTTAISTIDPSGVALAGVQEIIKQNQEFKKSNDDLKILLLNLERRVAELEKH